ncbi:MAG: flagellar motor switch protein FliN, partial [candidate division Zixibacteria bacterium]|nr:flagellar motor switch protein FliN [candidate division Zixibacteria bacterium]
AAAAAQPGAEAETAAREAVRQAAAREQLSGKEADAAMMAMLEDLPQEQSKTAPEDIRFGSAEVAEAEFQHLSEPAAKPAPRNIGLLMDVNLPLSIELGRTRMSIADILSLGPGSVVELNKLAGEPVDVLVNGKIVARGEVVVIDENFGVRIVQLMTPEQRLKLLSDEQ